MMSYRKTLFMAAAAAGVMLLATEAGATMGGNSPRSQAVSMGNSSGTPQWSYSGPKGVNELNPAARAAFYAASGGNHYDPNLSCSACHTGGHNASAFGPGGQRGVNPDGTKTGTW
jgi:hypothetical protein